MAGYEYRNNNHAALTSDENSVIIVGTLDGYRAYDCSIFVLNIQDDDNYDLRHCMYIDIPWYGFKTPYPIVMKQHDINVILLTSGWFRKSFSSKQQEHVVWPLDILKLIDKFVSQDMLHLISIHSADGALKHVVFAMADILASNSAEMPTPRVLPGPEFQSSGAWNELIPIDNIPFTNTQFTICLCFLLVAYFCRIHMDW